ncbi:MAG: cell division protein ZapA [Bacteroidales bacterium]|jgi:cell division protein ZapA|nr:cell division protein ZapA [Bacteroidales bacterium]
MTIRVKIAERIYPFGITNQEDEEQIRKSALDINQMLSDLKMQYSDKDVQDFLAMIALRAQFKLIKYEAVDLNRIETLNRMNAEIKGFLDTQNL